MNFRTFLLFLAALFGFCTANAQSSFDIFSEENSSVIEIDSITPVYASILDSLMAESHPEKELMSMTPLPKTIILPVIYNKYNYPDTMEVFKSDYSGLEQLKWLEDEIAAYNRLSNIQRNYLFKYALDVRYNMSTLPEPPKEYIVKVNPEDHTITIHEALPTSGVSSSLETSEIKKVHWLKTFNASLQFSQAYVSPNWYQGGNNSLNALLNIYYNVKLNPAYHKNLLFESTLQYKLGINSTPDDTLRNYYVSEDILQLNSVFGLKAVKKWYYSVTAQFKTQVVNSYATNTNNLRSALLSPAELNIGVGMSYKTENASKTFSLDASISPLSYNLMICTNDKMNVTAFGIEAGKHTVSKYGSSGECNMLWKMSSNISLRSRVFAFTNYSRAYADWENTLMFEINRFLTTTLFVHLRYDTDTPPVEDPDWSKLQVKEILSLGFAYKFSTK